MGRLTKEEQEKLVKESCAGNMEAFQKLVEELETFVSGTMRTIFREYNEKGVDLSNVSREDVMYAGIGGLIKAVYKWDMRFENQFTTYAYKYISGEIKKQLSFELNRTGVTETNKFFDVISIEEDNSIAERLISMDTAAIEKIIEADELDDEKKRMSKIFEVLSENEKKVLIMIHGMDCEETTNHKKIAKELGISEVMVMITLEEAKKKIKKLLGE